MSEIKVPFSYCKISRASNLLGCESTDLINLAIEGRIELCMMLDNFHCRILFKGSMEMADDWYSKLTFPSRVMRPLSGQTRAITKHSFIEFSNKKYFDSKELVTGVDIFNEEEGNGFIVGYAFAHGLWKVGVSVSGFEVNSTINNMFPGFSPCLSGDDCPVVQILPAKPFIENKETGRLRIDNLEFKASYDDLWITSYDIRRIIDSGYDFDSLSVLNNKGLPEFDNMGNINNQVIKSHPTAERHSKNRLDVVMAAINFKEKHQDAFKSECIKSDGSYNFTEWARQVLDRPALFPNCEIKIKSIDTVQGYISAIFKAPDERR
ncbi:hypothetical protein [Yersinia hibernica]|uniref:Uncharacterized protein n=1 Tax=Yersinia enterocolitica LC20 TaxID=1443113 RepID=A0A7U4GCQ6_YEREN|nr:hypothetical protein [Yersinia hibernica]AHM71817.1 hypothetical protein LC20_00561 [Yersinia hibernica]